jgi:cyclopropane-fatty-acyl-phospholipid synthase
MNAATLRTPLSLSMQLLERGWLPDFLVRFGIRRQLRTRLEEEDCGDAESQQAHLMKLIERLRNSAVAIHTQEANLQHYEVPSGFFQRVLGPHLKYSSCYFKEGNETLEQAEAEMLRLTCERAQLQDGERVLELGCGWGSLSLWMAERFPRSHITAVSNSRSQKRFIDRLAMERGLPNLKIVTCDVNQLNFPQSTRFDRVVSVEMFEHMRNYESLMARIATWLAPHGTLFVHIFTHKTYAYPFEVRDQNDWMASHFFTGGIMPSDDLLLYFQGDLKIARHWHVEGTHYQRTSELWLRNMDSNREEIEPLLAEVYGDAAARRWWVYWRVFFMACAELWGYAHGREWLVSHYLFRKHAA